MNLGVSKYYPRWDAHIYISTFWWGKSLFRLSGCNLSFNTKSCTKTYVHTQKCLHFLLESHSRRTKWNGYDVRAKNYFSLFLFIPHSDLGVLLCLMNSSNLTVPHSIFKLLCPRCFSLMSTQTEWQQLAQEKGIQNILNRSPQKKYITVIVQ